MKSWKATSRKRASSVRNAARLDFTGIRQFNLMFKTFQGVTEDSQSEIYLRPETAQGIFVNFQECTENFQKKDPVSVSHR